MQSLYATNSGITALPTAWSYVDGSKCGTELAAAVARLPDLGELRMPERLRRVTGRAPAAQTSNARLGRDILKRERSRGLLRRGATRWASRMEKRGLGAAGIWCAAAGIPLPNPFRGAPVPGGQEQWNSASAGELSSQLVGLALGLNGRGDDHLGFVHVANRIGPAHAHGDPQSAHEVLGAVGDRGGAV